MQQGGDYKKMIARRRGYYHLPLLPETAGKQRSERVIHTTGIQKEGD